MDIEFHYYITFIIARKAGFSATDSSVIAYASQYTDDNTYHYCVNFTKRNQYLTPITQTMDITKPTEKRRAIYPLFHFFPGDPASPTAQRKDGRTHSFNTTPDSKNARQMFDDALRSRNLYRIGIAAHAFADTWAHQNFCGLKDDFNAISSPSGIFTPNIGHADAGHNPDLVCHRWTDNRLIAGYEEIDNNQRFIEAARRIYEQFRRLIDPQVGSQDIEEEWSALRVELVDAMKIRLTREVLSDAHQKARIKAYQSICPDMPEYDKDKWRHDALYKDTTELDIFDRYWGKDNFFDSPWYRFQEAAKEHHDVSMGILEPLFP